VVVEVAELTTGDGVPEGSAVKVCAIAVFNMDSAVPALSTTGDAGGGGAGVKGRQAAVRRSNTIERNALFIQTSLRL
jgi:hypothetical protein